MKKDTTEAKHLKQDKDETSVTNDDCIKTEKNLTWVEIQVHKSATSGSPASKIYWEKAQLK